MARPKRYANEAEKQKAYRDRKKGLDLGVEESASESTVPRIEMTVPEVMINPAYGKLEIEDRGVELVQRRCNLCERTWGSTILITCPYCHGKGIKTV